MFHKNLSYALLGYGISNRAVADVLTHEGITKLSVRSQQPIENPPLGALCISGDGWLANLHENVLIRSPSVRPDLPEIQTAMKNGAILTSDAECFFSETKSVTFGITGSDGKSTASTMVADLLRQGIFPDANLGGNIGHALISFLLKEKNTVTPSAAVAELSSFQLQDTVFPLHRATVTNVTPNHLNWHRDFEEYLQAKRGIFTVCDEPVFNADIPDFSPPKNIFAACSYFKSRRELTGNLTAEHFVTNENGSLTVDGVPILDWSRFAPQGEHNRKNFLLAVAMTLGYVDEIGVRSVAETFSPLPHRMQTTATVNGVDFVDSSVDSTPSRTLTTLTALSSVGKEILLLLCGEDKNLSYECLLPALRQTVHLFLWGEAGKKMSACLPENSPPFSQVGGLREAFSRAVEIAKPGQTVLLSPAATSFDEFRNYHERGLFFTRLANEYARKCK